jgi:hypothetical protein
MADSLQLNVDTLGDTFRTQAFGLRRLADGILDGDFRRSLLSLASDYDAQAVKIERKTVLSGMLCWWVCVIKRLRPSVSDEAVFARHVAMELVRQYPELWSQLNAMTLAKSVDWPAVLRALEIDKPPTGSLTTRWCAIDIELGGRFSKKNSYGGAAIDGSEASQSVPKARMPRTFAKIDGVRPSHDQQKIDRMVPRLQHEIEEPFPTDANAAL